MLESGQRWKSAAITTSNDVRFFNEVNIFFMKYDKYLNILFKEIKKALKKDEVPVAALIVNNNTGKIIGKYHNNREKSYKTINHAEVLCINKANKCMRNKILDNCSLYVTLEPCEMCKSIIKEARVDKVYYLLERNLGKKQYYKTNFENWNVSKESINKYQKILTNFFKKRRL